MDDRLREYDVKMEKTEKALIAELDGIRAGRANPAVLDRLHVDYYGAPTPLSGVAAISVPEPKMLVIQPWDKSTLKLIEKAIQASDIGINPQNDGNVIRLVFPAVTEERRKELVKQVEKKGEESKVAIRSIRRDSIEKFKAMQKKSEITEDDLKGIEKKIQEMHDKHIKNIDVILAKKEKDIMEV